MPALPICPPLLRRIVLYVYWLLWLLFASYLREGGDRPPFSVSTGYAILARAPSAAGTLGCPDTMALSRSKHEALVGSLDAASIAQASSEDGRDLTP
jgi:hypothetical protein